MGSVNSKSIVLLSSGLDSAVALAWVHSEGHEIDCALTFDYGQRAREKELKHAQLICQHYGIPHEVVSLPWFSLLKAQGLLSQSTPLAQPKLKDLNDLKECTKSAS